MPNALERAKEIRDEIDALDAKREALWQEYLRVLPAGQVDAEDMAWAQNNAGVGGMDGGGSDAKGTHGE